MEVFSQSKGLLCRISEVTALLTKILPEVGREVWALKEGDKIEGREVALRIKAPYGSFGLYETAICGHTGDDRGLDLLLAFGFDYRIEIFVPAAKRTWGYYVFPLLEGDRFVGRIEAKANREQGVLAITNLWSEPGVTWTARRFAKLEAELTRLARFVSVETVTWLRPRPIG